MNDTTVCPYFDHNEDICDVGCGYISSHDASMIIKFCSCQHQDCQKYRELTSYSGHQKPVPPTRNRHMPTNTTDRPDNTPVLGLFCYGVTAACYAADKLPILSFNPHLMAVIIIIGAIGQIYAGLNTLSKNPLRAIAFTGLGLFWLSILALDILPKSGYGLTTGPIPMMGYLAMWGMFTLILSQGLEQQARIFRVVLVLITAFLIILAMAHATGGTTFLLISALLGLASSLPGLYLGLRHINIETVQLFQPEVARSSKIRP